MINQHGYHRADCGIFYLRDRIECLPQLAEWMHLEWYKAQDCTIDDAWETLIARLNCYVLPLTLVALEAGEPVGMVSLKWDPSVTGPAVPCLSGLYVKPDARGRGLGQRLCRAAIQCACAFRLPSLTLYTPDKESFYQRLGWTRVGLKRVSWDPRECVYMQYATHSPRESCRMGCLNLLPRALP